MDDRHRKLKEEGQRLFSKRSGLMSFWQEAALNFYPEMADFTQNQAFGTDYAAHLSTSYPLLVRRQLGDALSAILRPAMLGTGSEGIWFAMRATQQTGESTTARAWLERATGTMRRAMYDRSAQFSRATKEADHMFATFGQAPLSASLNRNRTGLLYQAWHLRDVAWTENAEGEINAVWRKWSPDVMQLIETFGQRVAPEVSRKLKDDPSGTVNCLHCMIETERYERRGLGGKKIRTPWVSIWLDIDNDHMMEEIGSFSRRYIIPRWATIPGSQYAISPAVTAGLPDARLVQAMTQTILEASEKFAEPPIVATEHVVRSALQTFAGGVTWVDEEYDERAGPALRPLYPQKTGQGLNAAFEMRNDVRELIAKAFFLDSLSLPPAGVKDMTAFEVGERISEWIRRATPIFEPMEFEFNGRLCEETFDILMRNGAFGAPHEIPEELQGEDIEFKFESPLHQSHDRQKGQKFLEGVALVGQAIQLDRRAGFVLDATVGLRDALDGIGTPAKWTRDEKAIDQMEQDQQAAQQAEQILMGAKTSAEAARNLGGAAKDFAAARETPQAG